jgi:hypothetical protein
LRESEVTCQEPVTDRFNWIQKVELLKCLLLMKPVGGYRNERARLRWRATVMLNERFLINFTKTMSDTNRDLFSIHNPEMSLNCVLAIKISDQIKEE